MINIMQLELIQLQSQEERERRTRNEEVNATDEHSDNGSNNYSSGYDID